MPAYLPPAPAHLPHVPVYVPPPLVPATLSTSLPPSLSSSLPFACLLNSYILSISPFVSLPTIP